MMSAPSSFSFRINIKIDLHRNKCIYFLLSKRGRSEFITLSHFSSSINPSDVLASSLWDGEAVIDENQPFIPFLYTCMSSMDGNRLHSRHRELISIQYMESSQNSWIDVAKPTIQVFDTEC